MFDFDELNVLKTKIAAVKAADPQQLKKDKGYYIDEVTDFFVLAYVYGVNEAGGQLGADIMPDLDDLKEALERIAPSGLDYHHDEIWHDGNGYAHIRAALMGSSTCVALKDGLLNLGTWQQIILMDFDNKPRSRCITVQIVY